MPDSNKLPSPIQILGESKVSKKNNLPSPDQILNTPSKSSGTDYSAVFDTQLDDDKVESAINFLAENPTTKGGLIDVDKDILRNVMKNPNVTQDQIKEAIGTMQSGNLYYLKNENGVIIPKQLKEGQRPPKGYNVQSVWGTQQDANDDAWYTDLGKSLYNGVIGGAEGAIDLAQMGTMAVTGKESTYLNKLSNTAEALKAQKDEDLNKPIYNTENVNQWSDLIDKDRFDLSPGALWGTLNMAAESVTSFYGGAKAATNLAKLGPKASAYVGSYLTQLGDNLDNAKEAGLEGREAAAFASLTTSLQAAIDAQFGLESKIYQGTFKKSANDLMKDLAISIPKDAEGKITQEGFKQLAKETTLQYGKLAKIGVKEIGKDALKEGAQETGQDFVAKAAENLWDKMDINDRNKFGTEINSPESFASYIQNGLSGLVAGTPMAAVSNNIKKKYNEQSKNAYDIVQQGPEAVNELKANLTVAKEKGVLSPQEYDQAVFKVDAYQKYDEQTKDLNLDDKQKKEAFELSFNIEALKSETDFKEDELKKLDPIALAKIDSKKKLIKGLQEQLNNIILKEDVQKETKVGQDTVDKVVKNEEPKEDQMTLKRLINKLGKPTASDAAKTKTDVTPEVKDEKKPYKQYNYDRENTPDFDLKDDKGVYEFNKLTDPISKRRAITNYLDERPELNNELKGTVYQGQNNVWQVDVGGGRFVQFGRSIKPEEFIGDAENLPEETEIVKDSDGRELVKYKQPVIVKVESITDDNGGRKRILNVYNEKTGKYIVSVKEKQKGGSSYSDNEIKQMQDIQKRGYVAPVKKGLPKTTPVESKGREIKEVEISQSERDNLLADEYDNATIDKAVKESNDIRKLPAKELFNKLKDKGIFNLGTTGNLEFRPNVGLTAEEYKSTLKQLEAGKETKTVKKLMNFVEDIKETGNVSMIGMTGGKSEKYSMPLHQFLLENQSGQERGLSAEEEQEELEKESAREQVFAETGQFQKQSDRKGDFNKVVERIKKSFPKVNVVLDNTIKGAGQVKGNTISINPDYAGLDAPIHEGGHILIDAMGYTNKVIQSAVKQLRGTDIYKETKELYPELSQEMLDKEVLAQAIGVEGAGIFDKEVDKGKFKAFLDYIFNKLKQLLGIDKNIAKSLAKQIIRGQGTKSLTGENETVQEARKKGVMSEEEKDVKRLVDLIKEETDFNKYTNDQLLEIYNAVLATELSKNKKDAYLEDVMKRIALNVKQRGINTIGKEVDEDSAQKDISFIDKWFKVLSHFSDSFPEMKEFSKIWNSAYFAKMKESKAEKRTHDKLAEAVIKDRNAKLGIKDTGKRLLGQVISENRHNYFGFLDNGKGKLLTLEEAKKKGLSDAQMKYLRYTREMLAARQNIKTDIYEADMDVLRTDKSFLESYQTEGIISAVGSWLGSSSLSNIKLNFTDPSTGKTSQMDFIDIQNALSKYAEKGLKEKAQALGQLIKYTIKASKKRVKKGGEYLLDENGNLQSKFNRPVDERKSYSKDFYGALNQYIDDTAHIKHISPLVPIINSIEYLNSKDIFNADGELIGEQKKNLTEWIDKWRKLHVLGQSEETQPELDKALKLLRFMTSGITMWFNVPANILNVAIGNYNNFVHRDGETWAKGQKRLFGGTDRKVNKEYGYGVLNRYAADIVRKYSGVANDPDIKPIQTAGGFFANLGFMGQSWGEFQIQGSGLLGLMTDADYNSFEYKKNEYGVEELVVKKELNGKPVDEKALEERILANIDKISDIQGKYSEKDRRNIQNNELGKVALQFKQWMYDALRIRFGSEGNYRKLMRGAFAELRTDIKEKGKVKAFWENKAFMSSFKELATIGLLMSLVYQDDEDDDKSFTAKLFQRALSDVMFVFDPDNLKFTIKKPVAAVGTIEKLINVADHMFAFEADDYYKSDNKYGDEGDSKLRGDAASLLPAPGKKAIEYLNED